MKIDNEDNPFLNITDFLRKYHKNYFSLNATRNISVCGFKTDSGFKNARNKIDKLPEYGHYFSDRN